jgi:putative flippase GtrA
MRSEIQDRLRSPIAGQGLRFALSGGLVAAVYVGTTTLLGAVIGIRFQLAIAIGFVVAISVHFTLQRLFVWDRLRVFALPIRHQVTRYLAIAAIQYGLTAACTAALRALLHLPAETAYLITAASLSAGNFFLLRSRVFHPADPVPLR